MTAMERAAALVEGKSPQMDGSVVLMVRRFGASLPIGRVSRTVVDIVRDAVSAAIEAHAAEAVKAETERCAAIADGWDFGRLIAAEIRKGGGT